VIFAAKIVLAAVLIGWLVRSGSLKFSALAVLFHPPWLLALNCALFVTSISLNTARWRALLELCGARLGFFQAWRLQLLGAFLNTLIPGNVGGDIVKALAVARDNPNAQRHGILLVVLLERALGLAGLLALGGTIVAFRVPMLVSRGLGSLAWTVCLLAAAVLGGLLVFTIVARRWGKQLSERFSGPSRLGKFIAKVIDAMILLSAQPTVLLRGLVYSIAMHGCSMAFFTILASHLSGGAVSYGDVATVFPLGLLTLLLPISPAGFGVGHVAFDRLFTMVGLEGGATIFNVFLIGQIVPGLLGVIPYLSLRRERGEDSAA
jgi:hypothetical protein